FAERPATPARIHSASDIPAFPACPSGTLRGHDQTYKNSIRPRQALDRKALHRIAQVPFDSPGDRAGHASPQRDQPEDCRLPFWFGQHSISLFAVLASRPAELLT